MSRAPRTAEGLRRSNLAAVLELVHLRGELSRAELTAATGLNRSTVAALVGRLVEARLLAERPGRASDRVGRRSPLVSIDPYRVVVAVNPEVDGIAIATVDLAQTIHHRTRLALTKPTPEQVADAVADQIASWSRQTPDPQLPVAVGLAVPGLVRRPDGVVRDAPHLHWRDAPLADLVAKATGLPTHVGNDASLGAVAEHRFGAGRGLEHVIYLNGGASGIGGGLIVHGRLVDGAAGYAGELGQIRRPATDDGSGKAPRSSLEQVVNRARLLDALGVDYTTDAALGDALLAALGPEPGSEGSNSVVTEVRRQRAALASAIAAAANTLNPQLVVLGGFLAELAAVDLTGLRADVLADTMGPSGEELAIGPAALSDTVLLIGAAEAAWADTLADPR